MRRINIHDFTIDLDLLVGGYVEDCIPNYEIKQVGPADHCIQTKVVSSIDIPTTSALIQEENKWLYPTTLGETILSLDPKSKEVYARIDYDDKYQQIVIQFLKDYPINYLEMEYVWTGILFLEIALTHGYTALHGSAICYKGNAIIFSAPSGTGKSTQTHLWTSLFKEITIINDDKPLLRVEEGIPMVYGTPWSGKDVVNHNISCPVLAIVFLRQEKINQIYPLSNEQIVLELIRNTYRPRQAHLAQMNLQLIDQLIPSTKIFRYGCTKETSAVDTLYNYLYGGNINED
jgi:hypothetical protein